MTCFPTASPGGRSGKAAHGVVREAGFRVSPVRRYRMLVHFQSHGPCVTPGALITTTNSTVGLMLGQQRRRWTSIKTALGQLLLLAVVASQHLNLME